MIDRLIIKNFRSIENLDLAMGTLNALVGPNSSGKSNILKALNIIIGPRWPREDNFEDDDFYNRKKDSPIHIEIRFSQPVSSWKAAVDGFRLTYDGSDLQFVGIDKNGVTAKDKEKKDVWINSALRDQATMMYLPLERQSSNQVRASTWTLYGKLLRHIAANVDATEQGQFGTDVESTFSKNIGPHIIEIEKKLDAYVKEQTGLTLQLKLSIVDPAKLLKDVRPHIVDQKGFEIDIDGEGAGVQSAVSIAIARAYADVTHQPLVLTIEEPELFLHPHGCRHFYRILKDLSQNGIQVVYTTHERCFVRVEEYESVHRVVKKSGKTTVFSGHGVALNTIGLDVASKFCEETNEIFFADKVILVEGFDDKVSCSLALEALGVEFDKANISIIECGGIGNIPAMTKIAGQFGIGVRVIIDEDPGNNSTQKIRTSIENIAGKQNVFTQRPDLEGMLALPNPLSNEDAMRELPQWFAKNQVPSMYEQIAGTL